MIDIASISLLFVVDMLTKSLLCVKQELSEPERLEGELLIRRLQAELRTEEMRLVLLKKIRQTQILAAAQQQQQQVNLSAATAAAAAQAAQSQSVAMDYKSTNNNHTQKHHHQHSMGNL